MLIKGKHLNPKQKKLVLSAFVNRHTYEHLASWASHEPNEADLDWIRDHAFYFIQDGSRLSERKRYCVPHYWEDRK